MPIKLILKFTFILTALLTLFFILAACSDNKKEHLQSSVSSIGEAESESAVSTGIPQKVNNDKNKYKNEGITVNTFVILNNESSTIKGPGASFENGVLTISAAGTYSLQGTLSNGRIHINSTDTENEVMLYLNGVNISCSTDAPLFIENAGKSAVIFLSKGSVNSLKDSSRQFIEENIKQSRSSVIYSKSGLIIDGKGTLNIDANLNKAIHADKDITVKNGTLNIKSVKDGISGKQSITVKSGTINITCDGKGISSAKKDSKGNEKNFITVLQGIISVCSYKDCISADGDITVSGGTFNLISGGGCVGIPGNTTPTEESHEEKDIFDFLDPDGKRKPEEKPAEPKPKGPAGRGIKTNGILCVLGGSFNISSAGDSIHGYEVALSGGSFNLASDNIAIHSENKFTNKNAAINIVYSKKNFHFPKQTDTD